MFKFTDQEIRNLHVYFNNLDNDGGGSIGIEELETPLISLGIAKSREDVQEIVDKVDDDGDIYFDEFLQILCDHKEDEGENGEPGTDAQSTSSGLVNFFKSSKQLPF